MMLFRVMAPRKNTRRYSGVFLASDLVITPMVLSGMMRYLPMATAVASGGPSRSCWTTGGAAGTASLPSWMGDLMVLRHWQVAHNAGRRDSNRSQVVGPLLLVTACCHFSSVACSE